MLVCYPFSRLTRLSHAVDSGEASELMPGGTADFTLQPYLTGHPSVSKHAERMERLCFLVVGAVQVSTHKCIHRDIVCSAAYMYFLAIPFVCLLPTIYAVPPFAIFL